MKQFVKLFARLFVLLSVVIFCVNMSTGIQEDKPKQSKYGEGAPHYALLKKRRDDANNVINVYKGVLQVNGSKSRKVNYICFNDKIYKCEDNEGDTYVKVMPLDSSATEDIELSRIRSIKRIKEEDKDETKSVNKTLKDGSVIKLYCVELDILDAEKSEYSKKEYLVHPDLAAGYSFVDTGGASGKFVYEINSLTDIKLYVDGESKNSKESEESSDDANGLSL